MIGEQIGNYRVLRQLGQGGMGTVYEAVHEQIQRRVAIKVLRSEISRDRQVAQRFFNEARAVNIIDHPGMVEVFDFGHLPDGTAYIVMELLKGESLAVRLGRRARTGLGADALRIARQVASALAAAHEKGIIHRDLKPDNVMIVPDPETTGGERAKILDFGIAKVVEAGPGGAGAVLETATFAVMGTPAYIAPEQCQGARDVSAKADVYALGVMLYEMLLGRRPFVADSAVGLMFAHLKEPPPPLGQALPSLPAELVALVEAMLAKDAASRPTMAEVVGALERLGAVVTADALPQLTPAADTSCAMEATMLSGAAAAPPPVASPPTGLGMMSTLGGAAAELAQPESTRPPSLAAPGTTAGASQAPPGAGRRRAMAGIGVGLGALGIVALLWGMGRGTHTEQGRITAPPGSSPAVVLPSEVRWVVSSEPPGAAVLALPGRRVLGTTPWRSVLPRGGGALDVVLHHDGFFDKKLSLDRARDVKRHEKLVPISDKNIQLLE